MSPKVAGPFCIPTSNEGESSHCSTSSLTFGVVGVPDFGLSNRCVVISCCFDFHFPDDISCWAYFHILIYHLFVFFDMAFVQVSGLFFNLVIFFSLLCFKNLLCILNSSYQMRLLEIFSPSLCLILFS